VDKQFCVNISMLGVFLLATNYMLETLCRKETTCCETYSRISCNGAFRRQETTCSRHVVLRKCILTTFCTKKTTCWGLFAGKRRRIRACCKEKWQVERRLKRRGHPFDVFTARRQYGHNALRSQ